MMRIDSHHHFWRLDRGDHGWISPDYPVLYRDVMPDSMAPLIAEAGIDRTIVVQTAENVAETEFLLSLAARTSFVAGVVGWVDFADASGPVQAERLASDRRLVGLRPMLQDLTDAQWLARPAIAPTIAAMQRLGLRLDALIRPRHLPGLLDFASKHPDLPIVIDHAAKPLIAWSQLSEWAVLIRRVARERQVFCKISGLINNAGERWDAHKLRPYVEVLLDAFGPDRLMFGSDWPMVELLGDYASWKNAVEELTAGLSSSERAMIFGGTAAAFYGVAND